MCLHNGSCRAAPDPFAGNSKSQGRGRNLLHPDLDRAGQAVLCRNEPGRAADDVALHANAPVADFIADRSDAAFDTSVLRPRKTLQAEPGSLAGPDAPQGRGRSNSATIRSAPEGTMAASLSPSCRTAPGRNVATSPSLPAMGGADVALLDVVLQAIDGCARRNALAFQAADLGFQSAHFGVAIAFARTLFPLLPGFGLPPTRNGRARTISSPPVRGRTRARE